MEKADAARWLRGASAFLSGKFVKSVSFFAAAGLLQRRLQCFHVLLHGVNVGVDRLLVRLARDNGIKRVDLRACLARDGFSGARRILRLGEEDLDGQFLDLLDRSLQLGGRRLGARLALNDADDVEAEFLGEVGEGFVEGHDILVRHGVEFGVHLGLERFELLDVGGSVLFVGVGVLGIGRLDLLGDVLHLQDGVGDAEPDMWILLIVVFQKLDALGGVDDLEVLLLLDDLVEEALHACAVDDEGIGFFERLHVLGHELVVVQAARLRLRHVGDGHAVDTLRDVDGGDVHGVEGCDDVEGAVLAASRRVRAAAAREKQAERGK